LPQFIVSLQTIVLRFVHRISLGQFLTGRSLMNKIHNLVKQFLILLSLIVVAGCAFTSTTDTTKITSLNAKQFPPIEVKVNCNCEVPADFLQKLDEAYLSRVKELNGAVTKDRTAAIVSINQYSYRNDLLLIIVGPLGFAMTDDVKASVDIGGGKINSFETSNRSPFPFGRQGRLAKAVAEDISKSLFQ
jgi:hypothetical protein